MREVLDLNIRTPFSAWTFAAWQVYLPLNMFAGSARQTIAGASLNQSSLLQFALQRRDIEHRCSLPPELLSTYIAPNTMAAVIEAVRVSKRAA